MTLYFHDRTLRLAQPGEPVTDIPIRVYGPDEMKELVRRFLRDEHYKAITIKTPNFNREKSALFSCFTSVPAAGGFVGDPEHRRLFIFRNGNWDLPKGKIEQKYKHTIAAEAIREVREETGIYDLRILRELPVTYHIYQGKKGTEWFLKTTHWFDMLAPSDVPLIPQTEEGITQVCWFTAEQSGQVLSNTFPSLIPMINRWVAFYIKSS